MYKRIVSFLLAFVFLCTSIPVHAKSSNEQSTTANYLIKFNSLEKGVEELGTRLIHTYTRFPLAIAKLSLSEVNDLINDENVEYIEPDQQMSISSISKRDNLTDKSPKSSEHDSTIELDKVQPVKVAIIDTGITRDFVPQVVESVSFQGDREKRSDLNGHGTYVASVLTQVIPDVSVYDLQAFDEAGFGYNSAIIEAIEWAMQHAVDIVQMSFGSPDYSLAVAEAMSAAEQHGLLLVAAAGNRSALTIDYPARHNSVIAVGAIDDQNQRLDSTNKGNELELVAPGSNLEGVDHQGNKQQISGTSIATAYVVGVAAQYKKQFPGLSAAQIRELMRVHAQRLGAFEEYGYGKVQFQIEQKVEEENKESSEVEWDNEKVPSVESENSFETHEDLEGLGRHRLKLEQRLLELRRIAQANRQRLAAEEALLSKEDVINEFGVSESWVQEKLNDGYAVKELYSFLWKTQEIDKASGRPTAAKSLETNQLPEPRRQVNHSDSAVSEVISNLGEHIVPLPVSDVVPIERQGEESHSAPSAKPYEHLNNEDQPYDESTLHTSKLSSEVRVLNSPPEEIIKPVSRNSEAPYTVGLHSESVSMLSGDLTISETDLTLPGRGGLSFTLSRTYNSGNSQLYEMDYGVSYDYSYYFNYTQNESSRNIGYALSRKFQKDLVKYSCAGDNNGTVLSKRYYAQLTENHGIYWSGDALGNAVLFLPPDPAPELVHACNAAAPGVLFKFEYTFLDIITATVYSDWSSKSTSLSSEKASYFVADAARSSMQAGGLNSSGQGGTYSDGYYDYIRTYTVSSPLISVPTSATPYNTTSLDPLDNRFPIGKGWRWNIPYLKFDNGKTYVGLEDGSVYEVNGSQLKNYPWSDLSFTNDTTVTYNTLTSAFALKSVFGLSYFFDSSGKLLVIKDGYGNQTKFAYTNVTPYGMVLSSVTDAAENVMNIQYTTDQVILTADGRTVTYTKTTSNGKELLSQVKDPMNRTTTYSYDIENAYFNLLGTSPSHNNPYALLKTVTHPTGARTKYEYEVNAITRYLAAGQVNQAYRLANRKDVVTYSDNSTDDFNYASLVYSSDMAASYGSDATFTTSLIKGLLESKMTYLKDYVDSTVGNIYYNTESSVDDDKIAHITGYTYDQVKRRTAPTGTTSYIKNLSNNTSTTPVTTSQSFDDYQNVTSITSPLGLTSTYTYSGTTHRLVSSNEPVNQTDSVYTEIISRNNQGDVTEIKKRANNANGAILQHLVYDYDTFGNMTLIRNKEADRDEDTYITYSNTYNNAYPTAVTRSFKDVKDQLHNLTVSATYHAARGTIASFTEGKGAGYTTSFSYDNLNRLRGIVRPDNSTITITINDTDNEIVEEDETGVKTYVKWNSLGLESEKGFVINNNPRATFKADYDYLGRLAWTEDANGDQTVPQYDDWNRTTKVVQANLIESAFDYDDMNFRVTMTDIEGRTVREESDRFGRLLKEEQKSGINAFHTIWFGEYDESGRLKSFEDGRNKRAFYEYDPLGRLTKVIGAIPAETYQYTYRRNGLLASIVYPDQSKAFKSYDELGRLILTTDPMEQTEKYLYDKNNNLLEFEDKNGQIFNYVYNNRNFLESKSGSNDSISFTYRTNGTRETMTDNGNTQPTRYSYNNDTGELERIIFPDSKELTYVYNPDGTRSQMTTPFGDVVDYHYDDANRLEGLDWNQSNQVNYEYYLKGPLHTIAQSNGLTTEYIYDATKRLDKLLHKLGTTEQRSYDYNYDGNNNIDHILEKAATNTVLNEDFAYDNMNRITSSTRFNENYTYDNRGNRKTLSSDNSAYMQMGEVSYEYDDWNRLIKVTKPGETEVTYTYNGDNLMVSRSEGGQTTRYYYDGPNIISEGTVQSGGSVQHKASYLYGLGLVMREDAADAKSYYLHNGHGDVVSVRNNSGGILNSYEYDIWGNTIAATETVANPFRYSGEYWDDTTQLQYLRARWYDPSIGRFINEDTYEGEISNPLSLNLYTYVANNPLSYIDPTGHDYVVPGHNMSWYREAYANYDFYKSFIQSMVESGNYITQYSGYDNLLNDGQDYNLSQLRAGYKAGDKYSKLGMAAQGLLLRNDACSFLTDGCGGGSASFLEYGDGYLRIQLTTGDQVSEYTIVSIDGSRMQFQCNCFTVGTEVETKSGSVPIEEVNVGDEVLAKDEATGKVEYKEVELLIHRTVDKVYHLEIGSEVISTTEEHPFWVEGKGWIGAQHLRVGDLLKTSDDDNIAISNIVIEEKETKVYNLKVKDYHTFYVSNLKIWTHNCTPAINLGNTVHYDALNGGTGAQLPTYLQRMFPNTTFEFTRRGQKGADVKFLGGTHPSAYPGSFWSPNNNQGDFKPNTASGTRRFNRQFSNGGVERLPYDPVTGKPNF